MLALATTCSMLALATTCSRLALATAVICGKNNQSCHAGERQGRNNGCSGSFRSGGVQLAGDG
eukprot:146705-Chlamydomonas_euryale.AAC.1